MIPLRPTINLYYDKIIDNTPIPNGVLSYDYSKDFKRIPYSTESKPPVNRYTALFNVMKALKIDVNIFSGKETAKNLFYPVELNNGINWDIPFFKFIPSKTLSRIAKDKMKLLIFAPWLSLGHTNMKRLKLRIDQLADYGVPKDKVYIVLGDVNESYKQLFDTNNLFGIDWWQIYTQIAYKSRYGLEDWHWVFKDQHSIPLIPKKIANEDFNIDNWNPKYKFTAFCGSSRLHDTTLITELIYRNLDIHGIYSFNLTKDLPSLNPDDSRIIDKKKGEKYIQEKTKILKTLETTVKKIDFNINQIKNTPLGVHKSVYENSLVNIVSEPFTPPLDINYLDETNAIAPRMGVWRQIAKGHPFMVLGCVNTMGYISNEGYFTPTSLINGNYDKVSSTTKRVELICNNIERILSFSPQELQDRINETIPFMAKNKEKFYAKKNERKFQQLFREMMYE